MALPIKDTPVLTGKDADRFLEEVYLNDQKEFPERIKEMRENYEFFKSFERF